MFFNSLDIIFKFEYFTVFIKETISEKMCFGFEAAGFVGKVEMKTTGR